MHSKSIHVKIGLLTLFMLTSSGHSFAAEKTAVCPPFTDQEVVYRDLTVSYHERRYIVGGTVCVVEEVRKNKRDRQDESSKRQWKSSSRDDDE